VQAGQITFSIDGRSLTLGASTATLGSPYGDTGDYGSGYIGTLPFSGADQAVAQAPAQVPVTRTVLTDDSGIHIENAPLTLAPLVMAGSASMPAAPDLSAPYTVPESGFDTAHDIAVAGLVDAKNTPLQRTGFFLLATAEEPGYLFSQFVESIEKAPAQAVVAYKSFDAAYHADNSNDRLSYLSNGLLNSGESILGATGLYGIVENFVARNTIDLGLSNLQRAAPVAAPEVEAEVSSGAAADSTPQAVANDVAPGAASVRNVLGKYVSDIKPLSNADVYGVGITRSASDIPSILDKAGIPPEELSGYNFRVMSDDEYAARASLMGTDFDATYGPARIFPGRTYRFGGDIASPLVNGEMRTTIYLNPDIMSSDEAIVQAVSHEHFEISALSDEAALPIQGTTLRDLVSPSVYDNLHYNAVNFGDQALQKFRAGLSLFGY
jgi:hypothetical protein